MTALRWIAACLFYALAGAALGLALSALFYWLPL